MQWINGYLTFDGNCREAMEFYKKSLEAELEIMPVMDEQGKPKLTEDGKERIMHAKLSGGGGLLMASDAMGGMPVQVGNNFSLAIQNESVEEQDKFFAALGEGGKVTMPLQDTFWGARFGMLTDQFGINWMFNLDKPKG
ncbi:VOC family protein [Granulicella sibirica]|uniref:PhnB protein n=1 Tax=Granulicella sibirica TaxID=2479048 RepID=A0A4Q0T0G4_9BACT|nr:VOC family protein [Granulicella sibirica]RXH54981.1 PhnB protein [Granulicella sibirica]